jgi:uncharacterized protein
MLEPRRPRAPAGRQALCEAAEIERLEVLFAEEPALLCLPDDDTSACHLVEFLLAAGAGPAVRDKHGLTPAQIARKRDCWIPRR